MHLSENKDVLLDRVAFARRVVEELEDSLRIARDDRNGVILAAVQVGATEREAARAAGVTGPYVNRLKRAESGQDHP